MTPPDRTLSSRFEKKYWLQPGQADAVRRIIAPFMRPDRYALDRPGYRYRLSSLYLDSPGLDLYRSTVEGHKNRFKLRVRTYADDPQTPAFFEIKRRVDQVIKKVRAKVPRELAMGFLEGRDVPHEGMSPAFSEYVQLVRRLGASPTMRVRYEREAYESTGRDPVRITFDSELMCTTTKSPTLSLNGPGWVTVPTRGLIMEIKFTDGCPAWAMNMIQKLDLENCSIPKYVLSIDQARSAQGVTSKTYGTREGKQES